MSDMTSILIFIAGAALLIYSAEKLIVYLVGAASGLRVSVFLLAIIFTGIEFDDVALALAAIISPTKVNISRDYILLFALAPLVMIPFILTGPLTAVHGTVLVFLFVLFIAYVA